MDWNAAKTRGVSFLEFPQDQADEVWKIGEADSGKELPKLVLVEPACVDQVKSAVCELSYVGISGSHRVCD